MADKARAWWALPRSYKALLQQKREEGGFGGAEGVAARRAPYFWGQEYGNPTAGIDRPQGFVRDTFAAFQPTFVAIMTRGVTSA